ncbi:gamma-glutamyl-gamma-aminobutyraldehyde dehydrogenase/4-guanidinobutyraldehyde dehydrogenase/NAD-dependent aldehyde dehydrogenase [Arthrobacter silviterrae]|uniref:Aldehyde dehydrogenase n=1 Tax=Arthrobacter silviterrae TaxID=2026658 RepID=A0ABX0DCL9_9MICC|nr:aldehyde dehydrogenase [Arthrobacter silviterrae]MDQ0276489.1 gamma-glutamyl-gamma-aminobutyraldehyde dehydrogenase/4-guanidinobutyraldehyde dehydrogenase/NAD-dependent aldehyde dehydrogenase [Arthrobacter silviterrae]NGN84673.1 aldehyde dehydrogenase [Arthrobacter silviterrae]
MTTKQGWIQRAATLKPSSGLYIDGAFRSARDGQTFPTVSPRDGTVTAHIAAAGETDVDDAVTAAHRAYEAGAWSRTDRRYRQDVLVRLSELILENVEELALLESTDTGHPISDALGVDVPSCARTFRWYAEALDKVYDDVAPTPRNALAIISREPLGVIGAVVPWNYPLIISAWKVAPALAAGNSVVLKPSEQTSLSALRLAELATEAGVPAGVFNVIPGLGHVAGAALGRHPLVDKITFTGSPEVGRYFQLYASESNGKQVALELGGKSPQVVLHDVGDIKACASAVAWGIFYNAGQTCHGGSRLLVDERVHDELLAEVIKVGRSLKLGDPLDPETQIGTIIDDTQLQSILGYYKVAEAEGITVASGGTQVRPDGVEGGYYLEPTVLDGVDNAGRIGQEEIFGPVLAVSTFRGAAEGIRLANESKYGLAASIWTQDITTAHTAARELRAGTVWVNTFDVADIITPFGGFKESGFGRDRSLHALDAYSALKTTWIHLGDAPLGDD